MSDWENGFLLGALMANAVWIIGTFYFRITD
jgi:hypothetical protein